MALDRAQGRNILVFHLSSAGHVQFMLPVYEELKRRQAPLAYYIAMDYPMLDKIQDFGLPARRCFLAKIAKWLYLTDIFIEGEIYGRGPRQAVKVFAGHGQPNKHTNWSDENLRAFDVYFLYGPLEREMFEVIQQSRPESTRHIQLMNIGYPKLDAQLQGRYDREQILLDLGLDPLYRTVIYAPAWDPGGSLRNYGTRVAEALLSIKDINVIVKLHPVSLEPPDSPYYEFYTGGVDWSREFAALEEHPRFKYVNAYLVNPLLVASDVMVTDFSGVALEFMTLDRPVIYIDCPEFYEVTLRKWGSDPELAKNDDRFNAGRNYGVVVQDLSQMVSAVKRSLECPEELSEKRKAFISRFLYNPGKGSEMAANVILDLLRLSQTTQDLQENMAITHSDRRR